MRIFIAGATGVIGRRLVPLLLAAGHTVAGMTRSEEGAAWLRAAGATPYVVDVYDHDAVIDAVRNFSPDLLMHQLTDLPDDVAALPGKREDNARIRRKGTRNLLDAARAAGTGRILAQSVAWDLPPGDGADAVAELERTILEAGGVVLRYGQFHGPDTFHPDGPPEGPHVHIDRAAHLTAQALDAPGGVLTLLD